MQADTTSEFPAYFISHGGGPWPWMQEERETAYAELAAALSSIIPSLPHKPEAILMISAHWEKRAFTVQSSPNPGMLYDGYGFPEHTYAVRYASPGSPALAHDVAQLLQSQGIPAGLDAGDVSLLAGAGDDLFLCRLHGQGADRHDFVPEKRRLMATWLVVSNFSCVPRKRH